VLPYVVLPAVAFAAGFVDAIAGGGGLLTVPALLNFTPDVRLALGTNKGQSVFGAFASLTSFARAGRVNRKRAVPAFVAALVGSLAGVKLVLSIKPETLRPIVLVLLVLVAAFFLLRRKRAPRSAVVKVPGAPAAESSSTDVSSRVDSHGSGAGSDVSPGSDSHAPPGSDSHASSRADSHGSRADSHAPPGGIAIVREHPVVFALIVGGALGLYDGFFGPGTGTFLIALHTALFGDELTEASANAKVANFASNLGSVAMFASQGKIELKWALPMAVTQMLGGYVGAKAAIKGGERVVRAGVLAVTVALVVRLGWQMVG